METSVKILTSIIGYGTYFPALLAKKDLERRGVVTELLIFERLYSAEKKKLFHASAKAFADNFKLAQLANRVPVDYHASTDEVDVRLLYDNWSKNSSIHFLCFSGLWFEILKNYNPLVTKVKLSCCRMDAGNAHTWLNRSNLTIDHVYRVFDMDRRTVNYTFNLPSFVHLPFHQRKNEVIIHGGGWGLGNFIQSTKGLAACSYHRNIVIRNRDDYNPKEMGATFFMNDPDWDILSRNDDGKSFPSIGKIIESKVIEYFNNDEYHPILDLVKECKAIISKPGGMTLVDSLISCTPMFYLEPLGENELGNSLIIDSLKIGMSFKKWEQEGFAPHYLALFHENLNRLKCAIPDFVSVYLSNNEDFVL